MKFKFLGLVAILAAICLICSCGNGSGDSENAAPKTVALSFAVNAEGGALKTIAVEFDGIDVDTYQYKATALFENEFGTPQGDTDGAFVDFVDSETGEAGMFAQGKWEFEVRCLQDEVVVYQTAEPVEAYVNASTTTIEVTVVRQFEEGDGTLIIDAITAPAYSEWEAAEEGMSDYLVISGDFGDDITIYSSGTTNSGTTDAPNYRSTFENEGIEVAAGIYTMTFTVYDKGGHEVGSATRVVEIGVDLETTVSGALDSGKWLTETFKVTEKHIELVITATDPAATSDSEAISVNVNDTVEFVCTGTIKEGDTAVTDEEITYNLYVNGTKRFTTTNDSGTEVTLEWDTTDVDPGYYEVHIVATGVNLTTDGGDEAVVLVTVNPAE